jgi:hypothetical protein
MGVIAAQLGHSDTRMTERHYAHLALSYVANTVRGDCESGRSQTGHSGRRNLAWAAYGRIQAKCSPKNS